MHVSHYYPNKKMFILLLLLFVIIPASAPDTLWTRTYGGGYGDWIHSIAVMEDSGFVFTGESQSFGLGKRDAYLIRTDANGDSLWTRVYGGSEWDHGNAVLEMEDGGFFISGYTNSFSLGGAAFLIRTDHLGDTLWTKQYGGQGLKDDYQGFSLLLNSDGGFMIAGEKWYNPISCNIYLLRTDSLGDSLWTKIYGGGRFDAAHAIQHTHDGGYIVTGYTKSFGQGKSDVFLMRTDSNGDSLWFRTWGANKDDVGWSVQQTVDLGFIVAGVTESFGNGDVYLIKADSQGNTEWIKTYGGDKFDRGYSVQEINDGGFIIVGETKSFGAGEEDVYIIRTDRNGDSLWAKTCGGPDTDIGRTIQRVGDDGFIIAGWTFSYAVGGNDFYLIRLDKEAVGIKKRVNGERLTVNSLKNMEKIEIYDLMGRKIKTFPAIAYTNWKTENGIFIMRFVGKGFVTKKIIINK